jgi:hypothetical protein
MFFLAIVNCGTERLVPWTMGVAEHYSGHDELDVI